MNWLLIVTALNMEAVYPDADTCAAAAFAIENKMEHAAVCIPEPETHYNANKRMDIILNKFLAIIRELRSNDEKNINEIEKCASARPRNGCE